MLESLMISRNSLQITQDEPGRANISGILPQILGAEKIKILDNIFFLTPEIKNPLSSTSDSCKTLKDVSDILKMNNILNDLGYTKRKTFFHENTS